MKSTPLVMMRLAILAFSASIASAFGITLRPALRSSPPSLRPYGTTTLGRSCQTLLVPRRGSQEGVDAHRAAVASGADVESLADVVLGIIADDERRGALLVAVQGWPPAERAAWGDRFVAALAARGEAIQVEGRAAFERGEPTAAAEKKLWGIVDMTVILTHPHLEYINHAN